MCAADRDTSPRQYRLLRSAGSCFQAELHVAERLGVEGFVKLLTVWNVRPELCGRREDVEALLEDLKSVARLSSGSISQILDVWYTPNSIAFATEHVNGPTLADLNGKAREEGAALSRPLSLAVVLEAARALSLAHSPFSPAGAVIHGHLRPECMLVDPEGSVKVTGFGFSRFLPKVSPDGAWSRYGGHAYQSPERALHGSLDPRVDVYALGAILLEAVTGRSPFDNSSSAALESAVGRGELALRGLEPDFERVIRQACALDPEDRYEGVDELAAALSRLLFERGHAGHTSSLLRQALGAGVASWESSGLARMERTLEVDMLSEPEIPVVAARPAHREAPLVGRESELREVGACLAHAVGGQGSARLFLGEPGMGRSRLLRESVARLEVSEQRFSCLQVQCRPEERGRPGAAILRLLAAACGLPVDATLAELAMAVERLRAFGLDEPTLSAIREAAGAGESRVDQRSLGLIHKAALQCVSGLSREQPTVVVWDDVQWCDDSSRQGLDQLLGHVPLLPAAVLMAAAPDLASDWAEEAPPGIALQPLSAAACGAVAQALIPGAEHVDPALQDGLARASEGIPLLLEELVRHLLDEDRLVATRGTLHMRQGGTGLLPDLKATVRHRLMGLAAESQGIAIAAALAGPALRPSIIATAAELPPSRVRSALDALVEDERLLGRDAMGYSYLHERLRLAVLAAAGPASLFDVRSALARAILSTGGEIEAPLADHAADLLVACNDPSTAARTLAETARLAEKRGDYRGASQRYVRALELTRDREDLSPEARLPLCLDVGRSALHSLGLEAGARALEQAIPLAAEVGDLQAGAEARLLMCRVLARQGQLAAAVGMAKAALPLAKGSGDRVTLARVYGAIAETMQQWGEFGPDAEYIRKALTIAEQEGDLGRVGEFLQLMVMHAGGVGRYDETREYLERARSIAEAARDRLLLCQLRKAEALHLFFEGELDEALRVNLEGITEARRYGLEEVEVVMLHNLGDVHLQLGNLPEAVYYLGESLRRSEDAGFDRLAEANEMFIGFIEAAHLGSSTGFNRLRRAIKSGRRSGRPWNTTQGYQLLGRALLAQGDPAAAVAKLEKAVSYAEKTGVRFFIDEARQWLEQARAAGAASDDPQ